MLIEELLGAYVENQARLVFLLTSAQEEDGVGSLLR